jgi:hypothetical protein
VRGADRRLGEQARVGGIDTGRKRGRKAGGDRNARRQSKDGFLHVVSH